MSARALAGSGWLYGGRLEPQSKPCQSPSTNFRSRNSSAMLVRHLRWPRRSAPVPAGATAAAVGQTRKASVPSFRRRSTRGLLVSIVWCHATEALCTSDVAENLLRAGLLKCEIKLSCLAFLKTPSYVCNGSARHRDGKLQASVSIKRMCACMRSISMPQTSSKPTSMQEKAMQRHGRTKGQSYCQTPFPGHSKACLPI